jgi:hypothetical protein
MLAALRPVEGTSRWADAALALVSGDFAAAADQFAKIGTVPDEALARLCSARVAGREGELAAALTLVRSLRATAFLSRGKALLTR